MDKLAEAAEDAALGAVWAIGAAIASMERAQWISLAEVMPTELLAAIGLATRAAEIDDEYRNASLSRSTSC
jgi:hypothetical protein